MSAVLWVQVVLDDIPQLALNPVGIGDDEADAELVVGQEDGDELVIPPGDALPGDVDEPIVVPDLIEYAVGVLRLYQDHIAGTLGVLGVAVDRQ